MSCCFYACSAVRILQNVICGSGVNIALSDHHLAAPSNFLLQVQICCSESNRAVHFTLLSVVCPTTGP
jgi:hypothetical protein